MSSWFCCLKSSFYNEIVPIVMNSELALTGIQRDTIKREYVVLTSAAEQNAKSARLQHELSWRTVELGSILVSAFIVLQHITDVVDYPNAGQALFWSNLTISLGINYLLRTTMRSHLRDKYLLYNEISTTLRSMGYNFINLTGRYGSFADHDTAYQSFTQDVEAMRLFIMTQENSLTASAAAQTTSGAPMEQAPALPLSQNTSLLIAQSIGAGSQLKGTFHTTRVKSQVVTAAAASAAAAAAASAAAASAAAASAAADSDSDGGGTDGDGTYSGGTVEEVQKHVTLAIDSDISEVAAAVASAAAAASTSSVASLTPTSSSVVPDLKQPLSLSNVFRARIAASLPQTQSI